MSHSRKSKGQKYWEEKISQWKESKLNGNQFCIQYGINQTVFHRWKRKILNQETDKTLSLIELPISIKAQSPITEITFYYKHTRIEISNNFSEISLTKLLRVLKDT